ncbi:MAG TPA: DUF58 domain-containing protein [Gemmatimonadaceae bacterium]|nr:DUF58 domain-containing protein [Gemmatimonadaceae bacterium]
MTITRYGALLDAVRGVRWPARHAVSSAVVGAHHSRTRGTSAEFTEYRLYRQGDDPRRLDWRLLARSDRAYIRLANDRAVLPTMILLDTSASMAYPILSRLKWIHAQNLSVGLSAVAHAEGDPVGVALHDARGHVRVLPPRTRRSVVDEIARVVDAADPDGLEPLAPVLAALRAPRIVIVTDMLGDSDDMLRAARVHIVGGGEVHLAHVVAEEELEPPRRTLLAADPELPGVQRLLADASRRDYQNAFGEWRAEIARLWRAAGAAYTEVVTDEPASHAVRRIAGGVGVAS